MQPPDVMFLDVMIVAIGVIVIGLVVPSVGILFWFGIFLAAVIGSWWTVSMVKRHGNQY